MVHVSPQPPSWRRGNVVAGVLLTVLGVVVLVVCIVALKRPGSNASGSTVTISATVTRSASSPAASSSAAPRTSTSTSPARTSSAATSTAASSTSGTPTASADAKLVPLVVLNDTTTSGLARTASSTFPAGGWKVTYGNYSNDIVSTCAYYDPSVAGAQAAATALMAQFPAIQRVKEKFAGLPAGPVVVVLTSGYS